MRDVYPPGVRMSLRRDYPKEHAQKLEECRKSLRALESAISGKRSAGNPEEYAAFLDEACELIETIISTDPEFAQF